MGREIRYRNLSAVILTSVFSIAAMLIPIIASAETIGEIRGGIESAESEIEALHNEAEAISEQVNELNERIAAAEEDISARADDIEAKRDAISATCSSGYKGFSTASNALAAIANAANPFDLVLAIGYSSNSSDELGDAVSSLEADIASLEADKRRYEEDIEESERRRRELDETVAELEERKTELEGELSTTIERQLVSASSNDELRDAIIESVDDPLRKSLIRAAFTQIGVPYGYGSYSPGVALDCSGFTKWCYSQIGIDLPHWSVAQSRLVRPVAFDELQPGDLIFWVGTADGSLSGSHVAMWLGNNRLIHAGWSGIHVGSLYDGYTSYGTVL